MKSHRALLQNLMPSLSFVAGLMLAVPLEAESGAGDGDRAAL